MKKQLIGALLLVALVVVPVFSARAQTTAELQALINSLVQQVAALQAQLQALLAQQGGAPVINGVNGPTSLAAGQTGTWSLNVTAPAGATLNYYVDWGEMKTNVYGSAGSVARVVNQNTTFSRAYSGKGTYIITFYVVNASASGAPEAKTSITVNVGGTVSSAGSIGIGSSSLTLGYVNGAEALTANYLFKVYTGNKAACIATQGNFWPIAIGGKYQQGPSGVSYKPTSPTTVSMCQHTYGGSYEGYWIPANSALEFKLTANYNPLQMFAGTYYTNLDRVYVYNLDEQFYGKGGATNSVTIVGEKSPYISSISSSGGGLISYWGQRINPSADTFVIADKAYTISPSKDGSYYSYVPTSLVGNYTVFIKSLKGNSNNVGVTIGNSESPITVVYPNGGETLKAGNPYTIKWNSSLSPNQNVNIDMFMRLRSGAYQAGTLIEEHIKNNVPNTGSYTWTVPDMYAYGYLRDQFQVRVYTGTNTSPIKEDRSDRYFSIVPGISTPASVSFTNPSGGEVWQPGTTQSFTLSKAVSGGRLVLLKKSDPEFSSWQLNPNIKQYGSFTIPSNVKSDSDYYLRLDTWDDSGDNYTGTAYSRTFSVNSSIVPTGSTITITNSINGVLPLDTKVTVSWTDSSNQSPRYNLLLRGTAGGQWPIAYAITPSVNSSGTKSYQWTVGSLVDSPMPSLNNGYYVTVCHDYEGRCAYSNTFKVVEEPVVVAPASATASWNNNSTHPASHAIDGNPSTYYMACPKGVYPGGDPKYNNGYFQYDLGAIKQLAKVTFNFARHDWEGTSVDYPASAPTSYTINVSSDGSTWSNWSTKSNVQAASAEATGSQGVRYIRLNYTKVNDGTGWCAGIRDVTTLIQAQTASASPSSNLAAVLEAARSVLVGISTLLGR